MVWCLLLWNSDQLNQCLLDVPVLDSQAAPLRFVPNRGHSTLTSNTSSNPTFYIQAGALRLPEEGCVTGLDAPSTNHGFLTVNG
jgi:hypothetical protein